MLTLLILLVVSMFYILKKESIQDKIVQSLTNKIREKYNLDISIRSAKISFENGITMSDILLNDHQKDTLLYINKLKTNFNSVEKFFESEVRFSFLDIDGMIFKIIKHPNDDINNLQLFLQSLNLKIDESKFSPIISISSLKIINSEIRYLNEEGSYKIASLKSNNFIYGPDFIEIPFIDGELNIPQINSFSFKSNSLKYLGCSILIDNYSLVSKKGSFSGDIEYINSEGNLSSYFKKSKIISRHKIFEFQPSKSLYKLDSTLKISGELDLIGSLDSINIKNAIFDFGFSKLNTDLQILNMFSDNKRSFKGYLGIDSLQLKNLNNIFKTTIPQLKYFNDKSIKTLDITGLYSNNKWNLNSNIESDFGSFEIELNKNDAVDKNLISVDVKNLNLLKFSNLIPEGFVSASIVVELKDRVFDWSIDEGYFFKKKYNHINFKAKGIGDFEKGEISWMTSSFNTYTGLSIPNGDLEYDLSEKIKKISSEIDLKSYNLSNINKKIGGGKAIVSGIFKSKIEGKSVDDASIFLTVQNLKLEHNNGVLNSPDFYLNSTRNEGLRNFSVINSSIDSSWLSGEAIGDFDITKIDLLVNNALSETFPVIPKLKLLSDQELKFDFTLSKDLVNILNTDIQSTEDFKLSGYLSNNQFESYLDIEIPFFQFQDFFTQGIKININNKSSNKESKLLINKIIYQNYNLEKFSLGSKKINEKLSFNIGLNSINNGSDGFNLNFIVDNVNKNKRMFHLSESSIIYNKNKWVLKESENNPIVYDYSDTSFKVDNFFISSGVSEVMVNGVYSGIEDFDLNFDFKNTNFSQFLPQNQNFNTEGMFNSNWDIKNTNNDNSLNGYLKSSDIFINNVLVGEFDLKIGGNTKFNSYSMSWDLINKDIKTFSGLGNLIYNNISSKLDLDISFSNFDISFYSSPGSKSISNIKGDLSGELNIWGDLNNLQNTGSINLNNASFSIPYLNTTYDLSSNTKLRFNNKVIEFQSTKIFDSLFETEADVQAKFSHTNFKEWLMDLSLDSEGFLLLNKKETSDALFYGQGLIAGDISLKGPIKNLQLELVGSTAKGTSIKIPLKDTQEITDISFIKFVDKNTKKKSNELKKKQPLIEEIKGLEMRFELDINKNALVEIVIDQSSGSYLNGKGVGNLLMESNTNGKFNIWGDFTTSDGIYNFKNLGLLDKKFNLKEGGTIVWDGDPFGAQMDLNALYQVPGGANPAILLDNPNFNKKIPTEVGIHLQGNLLKPDNPIFEIFFPNTSTALVSEINYRLADPQISQLQSISLLSQGIFINEIGLSVEGITNNLYEKASDIFTSMIGDNDEKLKVGINYLQGDRNSELDIYSEDRLGVTLSTQVSDKILINGKIGVPIGGVNETMIVGDVQIDFILNEDGTLKAKVFNKENEFRYIGDKLGYTQGMGISYNVDFNTFKELMSIIIKNNSN